MGKITVKCPRCDREFDVRSILWNFECPNCEDLLPHEGLCDGKYVIVCGDCGRPITPEEVCDKGEIFCMNCQWTFPLYRLKHFPYELQGKMCPRFKDEPDFFPEEFDKSECTDCFYDDCKFFDPKRWEEERESTLKMMFCNRDDDDEDE
jgi:DNA-directed RNA polymerase subunit RPC12/RpoP